MIGKSLRSLQDPIVQMGSSLLLQCKNSQNVTIPHWIVLPRPDESNSVATYLACTVITRENQEFVTYKRLFPSSWFKASRHFVYDLHRGGRWIRMRGETVSEISGNFLQSLAPCYIHYEQVFHWPVRACLLNEWILNFALFLSSSIFHPETGDYSTEYLLLKYACRE